MKIIPVRLKENSYRIVVGNNILAQLPATLKKLNLGRDALIVTNPLINRLHAGSLERVLKRSGFSVKTFCVPDSETSKSSHELLKLINNMAVYGAGRNFFIIAFGGGVVGDLAGFAAAVYKRGIPYIQIPTSFLAQIDSAIGGKTGIDLDRGKNLVGAYYQPRVVFTDVALLKTLSQRQIRNGLAEAVKYGVIVDSGLFQYIEKNAARLLAGDLKFLTPVVIRSSQIKARVVTLDEKETKGLRMILNFGHTLGHAIESAGRYALYQHGEAIALGMQMASDLSFQMGLLAAKDARRIKEVIRKLGLPSKIKNLSAAAIMDKMRNDKKFKGTLNRFILAVKIGKVKSVSGVSQSLIGKVVSSYL